MSRRMTISEMEMLHAEERVLNTIEKYIKTEKFEVLSCRFNEERARRIMSPDFPPEDILEELVASYQDAIQCSTIASMDDVIKNVNSSLYSIFLQEYLDNGKKK